MDETAHQPVLVDSLSRTAVEADPLARLVDQALVT